MAGTKATIGSIVVNVLANANPFVRGMGKSGKAASKFERRAKSLQRTVSTLKTGLAAGFAIFTTGRIASSIKDTANEIDSLAKTARKLGVASDELAAIRFVGERSGVEVRTMDMALQRMTRRLAEAAKGGGEAKDAIAELGLNVAKLSREGPVQALKAIADAMSRVPNQADRVRLSFKLFDSEGVALVNVLNEGASGIKRLEDRAKALGITLSDEQTARVEAFADAMTDLSELLGGIKDRIVIDIAPAATRAVNALTEVMQGMKLLKGGQGESEAVKREAARSVPLNIIRGAQKEINDFLIGRQLKSGTAVKAGPVAATMGIRKGKTNIEAITEGQQGALDAAADAIDGGGISIGKGLLKASAAFDETIRKFEAGGLAIATKIKEAEEIGQRTHRDFMLREAAEMFGFGPRKEEEDKVLGETISRGTNEAVVKGSIEAYRAITRHQDRTAMDHLGEARKQTGILEAIRDAERVNVTTTGI